MVSTAKPKNRTHKQTAEKPARGNRALAVNRHTKIQRALYKIADAASAVMDLQEFYGKLHGIVGQLMYAENFFIATYNDQTDLITWPYYVDTVDLISPSPIPLSKQRGATGWILRHGETLADVDGSVARIMKRGEIELVGSISDGIGVPLKSDNKTIGALVVQSYKEHIKYTLEDIEILTFVAQHISTALDRARAIEETRQRNAELAVINSVQAGLASNLDIQSIYSLVGDKIRERFAADTTFIVFKDEERNLLFAAYYADRALRRSFSRPYGAGIAEVIIESGKPLLLRNALEQDRLGARHVVSPGAEKDLNQSVLGAPIVRNGKAYGAVSVQSYKVNAFDVNDQRLLQTLVSSMSVALENARLFDDTQRLLKETEDRAAELAIINSVQEGLASRLDIQAIYELVGEKIRETFNAQVVSIATYDRLTQLMHGQYYFEDGKVWPGITLASFGFRKHVVENRRPLIINKDMSRWMEEYENPVFQGAQPKSAVFMPMLVGEEPIGVISLQNNEQEGAFRESDLRLLETLVNSMSVALENARLFEETQQRNEELAIINSVQEGLASKLDMQSIYELIGEKVREVFHVEVIDIVNYDPVTNLISMPYSYERGDHSVFLPREPYGFRRQVIESRLPLLINQNFEELASRSDNPLLTGAWPKSALFVPLLVEGEVKSIISIQDLERENAFSASDVQLLETLCNAMAVALENARLFDETERLLKETEHRAHELATINTVGSALAAELDLNTLIELVGQQVRSVFKADIAFVALLDKDKNIINFPYQYGQQLEPIRLGQGLTSKIIQSGQPLLINEDMDRQRQQMRVKLIGKRARSFLGVPIFVNGEAIGAVSVQSTKEEGRFAENDQRLLSTIAANVGIAFQNARLFHETQRLFQAERQAHEQTETLRSVAQALNRSLSLTGVFHLVLTEIQKVIPYDSAGIYQVHGNRRVFVAGRGFANLEDLIGVSFEFNQQEDEIGYLISRSLQPLILEDAPEKYPQYFSTGSHAATKIRSYIAVPIVLNQKLIGMITLDREEPGFYTAEHAGLAMAFAAQAATAINNAQLFDETQQRNAELAIINSVQEGLASKLDVQGIYELVGDKIRAIFDANTVALATFDLQKDLMHRRYVIERGVRYFVDPTPIPRIWREFIQRGQSILLKEEFLEVMQRIDPTYIVPVGEMPKSVLSVPLKIQGETRGVISLQNVDRLNAFSESDLSLLETLANSMSVALENARLWEQEKLYRKALERELEIGREIQTGFLPETLPQVDGWEIAASLMPAREVAGDFYDAFELPDGNIGLVIADVCDKGVGAALFMTLFRSLIRITANQDTFEPMGEAGQSFFSPDRLRRAMTLTNNYIAETHQDSGMFATLFFGILDPHDGQLIYINGGHEPPLIIRSGNVREALAKTGPAVGAIPDSHFDVQVVQLNPGEILFAFTDGVPEAQDRRGEFFGRERLLAIFRQWDYSADKMIQTIEDKLCQYMDGVTQFDDITLLAVSRAG